MFRDLFTLRVNEFLILAARQTEFHRCTVNAEARGSLLAKVSQVRSMLWGYCLKICNSLISEFVVKFSMRK